MMIGRIQSTVAGIGWQTLIALLPISSMPLLVTLLGSDTVAAPSGVFLLLLILIWFLPYLLKNGSLPRPSLPLLAFAISVIFSSAGAFFLDIPPFKAIGTIQNEAKALLTLAIGLSFYLVSAVWPSSEDRLSLTFRIVNWSGLAILAWSLMQAFSWYAYNRYPEWMRDLHALVSVGPFYRQRVTGFTLEPSWLAHQLNLLYLPYWLAASVRDFSAHRFRLGNITFENFMLAGGALMIFLSLSRVGQLAFILMIAFLILRAGMRLVKWLEHKLIHRRPELATQNRFWISLSVYTGIILTIALFLFSLAYGLSRFDRRMAEVFSFSFSDSEAFLRYADRLNFGSRVAYWQAGWEVFDDYPWLGVGLGNAGYFFPQKISSFGWTFFEVRALMYRSMAVPNIKSLWIRILAESGLIGFSFFATWLFLQWKTTGLLEKSQSVLHRMVGLMGIFVLIGLLLEGFSIDSFALPYLWVSLGLVTAGGQICYNISNNGS